MPCQIVIRTVSGLIPSGAAQPNRLRVTGIASGCAGGVLLTSNVTAAMPTPATIDANGRFLVDVPLVGAVQCGDPVTVTAVCSTDATCSDYRPAVPLRCCEVTIVAVDGVVPTGSLTPTALRVSGTMYGCGSDQVTLAAPGVAAPRTVTVDPVTGSFAEQLTITGTPLTCGSPVTVTASCVGSVTGCGDQARVKSLECPQCFRAQIMVAPGPCTGVPPTSSVTLSAHIALAANGSGQFVWDYGDGTTSAPFTVSVPSGAPGASAAVTDTRPYPPGTYTAGLRRVDVGECPPVESTFTINCDTCPAVVTSVVVGDCAPDGSRPVTYTVSFNPPLGAGDTAYVTVYFGGPAVNGTTSATLSGTGPGTLSTPPVNLVHRPGGYSSTAAVTVLGPGNVALCVPPIPPTPFSTRPQGAPPGVDVDPCLPCPTAVQVVVSQPANLAQPHQSLEARVIWAPPAPPPPPPDPVGYDWTLILPDGRQATFPNGPAMVTTQAGWSGPGAIGGAIDLSLGGTYAVSVTAKFAATAGLPTDPVTGVGTCDLSGPGSFLLAGPPPNCPKLASVTVTTPACADETQNLSASIGFTASVQNPAAVAGQFEWDFGDRMSASNTATTVAPSAQHVYTKPGPYTVTVRLAGQGACPDSVVQGTFTIGRCPCPPGQARDAAGRCVPTTSTTPTTPTSSFSWCCVLIYTWLVLTVVFNLMLFYGLYSVWPVGTIIFIVVGALATIAFILWVALCCWPCILTFWRCCVFWQWQFVVVSISVAIMGLLQAVGSYVPVLSGNGLVLAIYSGYVLVLVGVLSAIGGCGRLPNPLDPRTWPPCCCPGSACP